MQIVQFDKEKDSAFEWTDPDLSSKQYCLLQTRPLGLVHSSISREIRRVICVLVGRWMPLSLQNMV